MSEAVYSRIRALPVGSAGDRLIPGCIVLEGGAFRGLYTSGVLDALMEAGINMQCTVGVSAGAMNGMNYVSGQIGRSGRINLRYRHDNRYVGLEAVRRNGGLIGFDFVFGHMDYVAEFDWKTFLDPRRDFYAVVTDLESAQPVYLHRDCGVSVSQAVRASASMPYVSRPVMLNGKPCLDGGCSVNIPVQWALLQGYEKIIVIRTRPFGFRKPLSTVHRVNAEELVYRNYPEFAQGLLHGHARYNGEMALTEQLAASGRIALIAPSQPVTVGRLERDMEKLGALYQLGRHDGMQSLPMLEKYLGTEAVS